MFSEKIHTKIKNTDSVIKYQVTIRLLSNVKQRERVIIKIWIYEFSKPRNGFLSRER